MILRCIALPQNAHSHSVFGGRHSVFGGFCDICKNQGRSQARGENPAPRVALYGVFRPAADISSIRIPANCPHSYFAARASLSAFIGAKFCIAVNGKKHRAAFAASHPPPPVFLPVRWYAVAGFGFAAGRHISQLPAARAAKTARAASARKAIFGNSPNSRIKRRFRRIRRRLR